MDMCCGQIAESDMQFDPTRDIAHYHASIAGKTGALLSTCCWLGAATAGASRSAVESLAQYGTELGAAFQIIDDVLDLYGESRVIGKTAGCDLRQGVFTLPVLIALREDPTMAELLVEGITDDSIAEVGRRVRAVGADRGAVDLALHHFRAALSQLADRDFTPEGKHLLILIAEAIFQPLGQLGFGDATPSGNDTARAQPCMT
jgi:heptaprenyl diphosphate synthase